MEDRPLSESELLARAKRGDGGAYEGIVARHQTIAFRTALLITRSERDAEEAAQDGFLKAYRALGRFRRNAEFRPWLLAIVANEARNRVASGRRRARLELRVAGERRTEDAVPSPEAALLGSEQRNRLLGAVAGLPERDRLVVSCRYLLELSERETAAALGWRRGTVKSRLSRALDRLGRELEEDDAPA